MMVNWLAGWAHRQSHAITGAGNAGTKYQKKMTIHSGAGASSGDDVYLKGHCINFPNDIDFTDDSGDAQLDFWIEDRALDPCVAWVEVSADLGSNQTIYVYYGKSGQGSVSNGANTFLSFDDFEDGANGSVPAGWTEDPACLIRVSNDANYVKAGIYGLKTLSVNGSRNNVSYRTIATMSTSKVNAVEFDIKVKVDSAGYYQYLQLMNGAADGILIAPRSGTWYYHNGSAWVSFGQTYTVGTFQHFKIYDIDFTAHKFSCDVNGAQKVNQGLFYAAQAQITRFDFASGGGTTFSFAFDNFFERRNVNPEPVNSTWGDEESAGPTAYTKTCSEILGLKDSLGPRTVKVNRTEVLGLKDSFSTRRGFVKVCSEILGMVDSFSSGHTLGLGVLIDQAGQWAKRKLPPFPRDLLLALRDYLKVKTEGYDTLANTHKEGQIIQVSRKVRIQIVGLGRDKPEGKDDS